MFSEPQEWSFEKLGHRGKLFEPNRHLASSSHLIVEIDGRLPAWLKQCECDFVYYVLDGEGTFLIGDHKEDCRQGDLVTVPKGTRFSYEGSGLRMLLTSTPPWESAQEQVLDTR